VSTDGKVHPANVCVWCNRPFPDTYPPALRAASSLSQEEWKIIDALFTTLEHGLSVEIKNETSELSALRAKVREAAKSRP
jgi:hypothetical protein